MQNILLITGGSKGIGEGVIAEYLAHDYTIFSIARTKSTHAGFKNVEQILFDLRSAEGHKELMNSILKQLKKEEIKKITLINNAGTLGKIGKLENIPADEINKTVQLNVVATLILNAVFIEQLKDWTCSKKIITISSGAAIKAIYGWSVYCSTKAAIEMMTKTIAIEQNEVKNGVKTIAIRPGVVDTGMQEQIRSADTSDFIDVERFRGYKTAGTLADVKTVSRKIYAVDSNETIENGAVINLADLK